MRNYFIFSTVLVVAATLSIAAQTPAPQQAFEVASLRIGNQSPAPASVDAPPWTQAFPTNRYYIHDLNLKLIIQLAYGLQPQFIEGPGWIDAENYSIDAKVDGDQQLTYEQIKPLLQNLLAQRLGLKAHRESRMEPGFHLVVGKSGTKMPAAAAGAKPQGISILSSGFNARALDMGTLASLMQHVIGQPVVDQTGLTGSYDIKLSYAPPNDPNANSNNPDIFTAIQDQLGLKLEPAKVPVDYLVIDHVDRTPTEN